MSKKNRTVFLYVGMLFAIWIVINLVAVNLSGLLGLRIDLTDEKLYELTPETEAILDGLNEPIEITVFSKESDFVVLIKEILVRYERRSKGNIKISYTDPYSNPDTVDEYIKKGYDVRQNSILVAGEKYGKLIKLDEMFTQNPDSGEITSLNCEEKLGAALLYVTSGETKTVVVLTGHGENISDGFVNLLETANMEIRYVALTTESGVGDADLMIIAAPQSDYSPEEIEKIADYLDNGGSAMIFADAAAGKLYNFKSYMEEWGVGLTGAVVGEKSQYTDTNPVSIVPVFAISPITEFFENNQLLPVMPGTTAMDQVFVSQSGVKTAKLMYSTDKAYIASGVDERDLKTPYTLAMTAESTKGSRLLVMGGKGIYSDSLITKSSFGNSLFLVQGINWCTDNKGAVNITAKELSDYSMRITQNRVIYFGILTIGVIPLIILIFGLVVYLKRKNR